MVTATLEDALRRGVGAAWAFRVDVEREAMGHFTRIAEGLEREHAPGQLLAAAVVAADDERRHGELCGELASDYGEAPPPRADAQRPLAPRSMGPSEALAYDVVAQCCVAETESVATVTSLIRRAEPSAVQQVLVAIGRDEVRHAQLGWAFVAWASQRRGLRFLGPYLPSMMAPAAEGLFEPHAPGADDAALARHGVLPRQEQRALFLATMEQVVLPGLERAGVPCESARRWLAGRRAAVEVGAHAGAASPGRADA